MDESSYRRAPVTGVRMPGMVSLTAGPSTASEKTRFCLIAREWLCGDPQEVRQLRWVVREKPDLCCLDSDIRTSAPHDDPHLGDGPWQDHRLRRRRRTRTFALPTAASPRSLPFRPAAPRRGLR